MSTPCLYQEGLTPLNNVQSVGTEILQFEQAAVATFSFDGVFVTFPRLRITTADASIDSKWETLYLTELRTPILTICVQ